MSNAIKTSVEVTGLAYYACVVEPKPPFSEFDAEGNRNHPAWEVTVLVDKEEAIKLGALGMVPKKDKFGNLVTFEHKDMFAFTFRKRTVTKEGLQQQAPKVVDSSGHEVVNTLVGNGSKVVVYGKVVKYTRAPKPGAYLDILQVIELVPYEPKGIAVKTFKNGFKVSNTDVLS